MKVTIKSVFGALALGAVLGYVTYTNNAQSISAGIAATGIGMFLSFPFVALAEILIRKGVEKVQYERDLRLAMAEMEDDE